jgi:hypothetical protein
MLDLNLPNGQEDNGAINPAFHLVFLKIQLNAWIRWLTMQ